MKKLDQELNEGEGDGVDRSPDDDKVNENKLDNEQKSKIIAINDLI